MSASAGGSPSRHDSSEDHEAVLVEGLEDISINSHRSDLES